MSPQEGGGLFRDRVRGRVGFAGNWWCNNQGNKVLSEGENVIHVVLYLAQKQYMPTNVL